MSAASEGFTRACGAYDAGQLAEAEDGFRGVLSGDGRHPGALYFLGAIAYQRGRRGRGQSTSTRLPPAPAVLAEGPCCRQGREAAADIERKLACRLSGPEE
jgi:hypothetical protein